jgi:hypothetical protein
MQRWPPQLISGGIARSFSSTCYCPFVEFTASGTIANSSADASPFRIGGKLSGKNATKHHQTSASPIIIDNRQFLFKRLARDRGDMQNAAQSDIPLKSRLTESSSFSLWVIAL